MGGVAVLEYQDRNYTRGTLRRHTEAERALRAEPAKQLDSVAAARRVDRVR